MIPALRKLRQEDIEWNLGEEITNKRPLKSKRGTLRR
jgi:hypothetical protein